MATHILIIGGDPSQNDEIEHLLCLVADYDLTIVTRKRDALAQIESARPRVSAIIINTPAPDMDAAAVCAALSRLQVHIPIIVLGEPLDELEIVRALDAGATDYIARPVRLGEFQARLRAHLRQHETSDSAVLRIGTYYFHASERWLHDPATDRFTRLTHKEAGVLKLLYRAAGAPVSRSKLLRDVWNYDVNIRTHTLETHIYRLRSKIERDPAKPLIILTDNRGYSLGNFRTGSLTPPGLPLAGSIK
jgi:DNA-binding response OmpR family regulator